jgi:hypoxanthine phosphoribosyltransferase
MLASLLSLRRKKARLIFKPTSSPNVLIRMIQLHDLQFVPLYSEAQVQDRVRVLGAQLMQRYADKRPLFISILSGAFVFASDLMRAFPGDCEVSFVKLSSYAGTQSTGTVQTVMGLEKAELEGRHLIVVEDIVDSGRTLHFFHEHLRQHAPASICTVAFLSKPDALAFPVVVDMVGFDIEDRFVVGYGLDYDGLGRNLPGIYVKA